MIRIDLAIFLPLLIAFGLLCFALGVTFMQYRRYKEEEAKAIETREAYKKVMVQHANEHVKAMQEIEELRESLQAEPRDETEN